MADLHEKRKFGGARFAHGVFGTALLLMVQLGAAVGNEETFATNIINNDLNGSGNRNGNHPNNAATIDGNTPGSLHREEEQWALFNSANVGNVKRGERLLQEETPAPTPSPAGDDEETPSPADEGTPSPGEEETPSPVEEENLSLVDETPTPVGETPSPTEDVVVEEVVETPSPIRETPSPAVVGEEVLETFSPVVVVEKGVETPSPTEETDDSQKEGAETPSPIEETDGSQEEVAETPSPVEEGAMDTPTPAAETRQTFSPVGDEVVESPSPIENSSDGLAFAPSLSPEVEETPTPVNEIDQTIAPIQEAVTSAPVFLGTSAPYAPSTCSNGIPGVSDGSVCCKEQCGQCGGEGCGSIAGTNGASDCCPSAIIEAAGENFCGEAPCVMGGFTPSPINPAVGGVAAPVAPSACSNGMAGYQDGDACCLEICGQCGGAGCGTIPGTGGASNCCSSSIRQVGLSCEFAGGAPCIIQGYTPAPAVVGGGTAAPFGTSTCSNGFAGYQSGKVCCAANCGQCGGSGCGNVPGTGGSSTCCSSVIETEGESCDITGESPCIIEGYTPAPGVVGGGTTAPFGTSTCSNGFAGYQNGDVCCASNCGQCGGSGCGTVPGTGGTSACCSSVIETQGQSCDVTGESPCIIEGYTPSPVTPEYGSAAPVSPSVCSNGMRGYEDADVCCLEACGQCGGNGCGTIPGTGGSNFCCSSSIRAKGEMCGNGREPPCVMEGFTPSPINRAYVGSTAPFSPSTCMNGLAGVQNGAACCSESCGQCGGAGCGSIPGTGGSSNCCASTVMASNIFCGGEVEAPCIIDNYTPAPVTVPGDLAPFAVSNCSNGLAGVQDDNICCAETCGQCGGTGCGALQGTGGSAFCCSSTIAANGTTCDVAGASPCIISGWTATPSPTVFVTAAPVIPSTCSNGLDGFQKDGICCKMACGMCGGNGCGRVNGTAGASDCCPDAIAAANVTCGENVGAPCIIAVTPAPTVAPAATPPQTPVPFLSGNAIDFLGNNSTNAGNSRVQPPTSIVLPFMTAIAAFLGTVAFSAHRTA